ncbi:MAG: CCA tRNA nucleotidyltransferase [Kiritimatiellia bacterium]
MQNNDSANRLRDLAVLAARRIQEAGFTAYWAGGCVRDTLMGLPPKDYDIATDATPERVMELFPGSVPVGKAFAVVKAPLEEAWFEVAAFRRDDTYADGRHPVSVSPAEPEVDARRRDFTINAMFYDPVKDRLHDYAGGKNDLDRRVVRAVGQPEQRFREDHLRMMRAVRFATSLDFKLDTDTAAAIRRSAHLITRISPERVRGELTRTLMEAVKPGYAVRMLDDLGILEPVLPELIPMKGQVQPERFHPEGDVFVHTVLMLNMMKQRTVHLVYAVLFHDVGKPATAKLADGRMRFDGHASAGAEMTASIMRRLRFPAADVKAVSRCVHDHMRFMDVQKMKTSTLRRMVGSDTFPTELELHRLDCLASHGDLSNYGFLEDFQEKLSKEKPLPEPWVTGRDIMSFGVPEGPAVGKWRTIAYNAQLEEKFPDRESLLEWLEAEIERTISGKN